jgi:hypothetical protein
MSKIDLHLKYRKETGKPRPVEIDGLYIENEEMEDMEPQEIVIQKVEDLREYIDWLEEIVNSILMVPDLADKLRYNPPKEIIIKNKS